MTKAMNMQQQRILDALVESGWMVLERQTSAPDWWAAETWLVKSVWSPQDCLLYLTFMVDPQWEGERKETEGIWAAKASLAKPTQWQCQEGEVELSLGRGWERELSEFLQKLSELRNRVKNTQTGTYV